MVDGPVTHHRPLGDAEIDAVAVRLGLSLHSSIRLLWGQVGNGGFGPGYGIIGLVGGFRTDLGEDATEEYEARLLPDPRESSWKWPNGLLPICHWGCAVYTCIDVHSDAADLYRFDPNAVADDWNAAWFDEGQGLESWLRRWLDGEDLWMSPRLVEAGDGFLDSRS